MSLTIATNRGKVEITLPFKISNKVKSKLRSIFKSLAEKNDIGNEPLPGETMKEFLKRTDPDIDSPVNTIKGCITLYDWSQKELSKRSGLSVSYISDILHERKKIGKVSAKKLAKALNIEYRVLL